MFRIKTTPASRSCPGNIPGRTIIAGLAALLLAAATPPPDGFDSLVAAERDFAADAARIGIVEAFRSHAALDGVLFRPNPVPASAALAAEHDQAGVTLEWQPALAAIARSNDLGFTTGPYRLRVGGKVMWGQFLTVWQRDAEGRWRWVIDHGLPPVRGDLPAPLPREVRRIEAAAIAIPAGPAGGAPDLGLVEDSLNAALVERGAIALAPMIATGGRILRPGKEPIEAKAIAETLSGEAPVTSASRLFIRQSTAGDLAFTYGRIEGRAGNSSGHYVRIWQRSPAGWRMLVDEVVPVRSAS